MYWTIGILTLTAIAVVIALCYKAINKKSKATKTTGTDDTAPNQAMPCSGCAIGKESYELDLHSEACPYISSISGGKCSHFKPIEK